MSAIYTIEKSKVYGLEKSTREWVEVDVETDTRLLVDLYHEVEVGLYDIYEDKKTLKLSRYYSEISNRPMTIESWLATKKGQTIYGLADGHPVFNYGQTHYRNLAGIVKTAMAPRNVHPTQDFAMDDACDIIVETEPEDLAGVYKNMLFNINGAWVHSHYTGNTIALYGAGDVVKQSANTNLAGLSFEALGGVSTHLLKDLNYSLLADNVPHQNNSILITLPEHDVECSYMLSICGVLYSIPTSEHISDDVVSIPLGKLNIHDLLIHTRGRYDWRYLDIFKSDTVLDTKKLLSRETLFNLLDHESCFIVKVNAAGIKREEVLGLESVVVSHNRIKISLEKQLGFMVDDRRLTVNYWPIAAGKYWQIYFKEDDGVNRVMTTTGWTKHDSAELKPATIDPYLKLRYRMYNFTSRIPPYTEK